jgi:hypothetical protein
MIDLSSQKRRVLGIGTLVCFRAVMTEYSRSTAWAPGRRVPVSNEVDKREMRQRRTWRLLPHGVFLFIAANNHKSRITLAMRELLHGTTRGGVKSFNSIGREIFKKLLLIEIMFVTNSSHGRGGD